MLIFISSTIKKNVYHFLTYCNARGKEIWETPTLSATIFFPNQDQHAYIFERFEATYVLTGT